MGQIDVGFEKGSDRPDIPPVVGKWISHYPVLPYRQWDDLLTEILLIRFVQHIDEDIGFEDIDTHRGKAAFRTDPVPLYLEQSLGSQETIDHLRIMRFFNEFCDGSFTVDFEQAHPGSLLAGNRVDTERDVCLRLSVMVDKPAVIHPVEVVAGEDEHLVGLEVCCVYHRRPDSVSRPLEPVRTVRRLFRGQDVDKTVCEGVELVSLHDVTVQARRHELREDEDALDPGVDAVRDRDVYKSVLPGEADGRFRAMEGEWIETGTASSAQDDCSNIDQRDSPEILPGSVQGTLEIIWLELRYAILKKI